MRHSTPTAFLFGMLAALSLLTLASCDRGPATKTGLGSGAREIGGTDGRPLVACTTPMVGDLVRALAGDRVTVEVLVAPGTDPHLWSPTRTEVFRILEADAVVLNGLHLEGRVGDAFARVEASGRPVLRLAESLPKAELLTNSANSSQFDPHVWMDPVLWARTAPAALEMLVKLDPAGADEFARNAKAFEAAAAALDRECAMLIDSIPHASRTLVTAHDAFGYFGRRYGIEVRGIQGISTESEASLAQIERLVVELQEKSIPTVFVESTVSDRTVRALVDGCAAAGHEVRIGEPLYSDSMGRAGTAEGTWIGMIRHNARAIAAGLGGRG